MKYQTSAALCENLCGSLRQENIKPRNFSQRAAEGEIHKDCFLVFHDNLTINFSGVDNLVVYDASGRFVRRLTINSNSIALQGLTDGVYIGVFYRNETIVNTVRMIRE